ncbi:MAG: transporter related [Thermoleophilia bacterium]|nr:transporter related [Thermoleophilia bacterium]
MGHDLAVDVRGVVKRYGSLVAVNEVTLAVEQGSVYGVLGPNGAGKTTLLRMLFGLIAADAGTIRVFGRSWASDGARMLDGVGGFIESPKFYPYLSGRRNLEGLARLDGGVAGSRIDEVLDTVELADRQNDKVRTYSFGMRQRLGVAASLLRAPQLLVLDEPSNGLDPAGIRDMRALISRLASEGLTVLLSSHDLHEVEEICDNVTIMRTGDVLYHGSIEELRDRAPESGHRLQTTDDERARELADGVDGVRLVADDGGPMLAFGTPENIDDFVRMIVADGVRLRLLEPDRAPLESLFFLLTEDRQDEDEVNL